MRGPEAKYLTVVIAQCCNGTTVFSPAPTDHSVIHVYVQKTNGWGDPDDQWRDLTGIGPIEVTNDSPHSLSRGLWGIPNDCACFLGDTPCGARVGLHLSW